MFTKERRDWRNQLSGVHKNIKKSIKCVKLILFVVVIALHTWSVQTHIPICQIFKEIKQRTNDIEELV